ncbi:MAG: OmpH family outer membrane protein [Nevskia sp.]|nr:OmpH family outer membrane protein [Nevskia sp.]
MMQLRFRSVFAALAVLLLASAPAMADTKIAVVRGIGDVFQGSAAIKAAAAKLQGDAERRKALLESEAKQLSEDYQKYQRDNATYSPDQREKTEKDLTARKAQLEYDQQRAQEEFQGKGGELQNVWVGKMQEVMVQVAKEKGFDVVVTGAIPINKSLDITDEVIRRLDAQNAPAAAGK